MKWGLSKLVSARRSTVLNLPLQEDFLATQYKFSSLHVKKLLASLLISKTNRLECLSMANAISLA
jgi:hypothetical protein